VPLLQVLADAQGSATAVPFDQIDKVGVLESTGCIKQHSVFANLPVFSATLSMP